MSPESVLQRSREVAASLCNELHALTSIGVSELPELFEACAAVLELSAPSAATPWRIAARITERALAWDGERRLSVAEAAEQVGWHYESLRRRIRQSGLCPPNGRPWISQKDLRALGLGSRPPRNRSAAGGVDGARHASPLLAHATGREADATARIEAIIQEAIEYAPCPHDGAERAR